MTTRATGPFEVKLVPLGVENAPAEALLGRMSIEKVYHGDLEATASGQMLTAGSATKGSAAYVAVERVSGSLHGKTGAFALYHTGAMNRGAPSLAISVVPDSGTGELTGLAGTLNIIMEGGKHAYELDYTLG